MYTNYGLVKHAQKALADKTKYMWGGIYRPITDNYVNTLAKMYPTQYSSARKNMLKALPDGYYGIDCVGLVKSYYWSGFANGGKCSPDYGKAGYPDVNAVAMYSAATKKGTISTLPEIVGIVLFCKSSPHVGVYIGNGEVIESTLGSRGDGVVKTKLSAFKWEYWFKCPYIEYFDEPATVATSLKVGDTVKVKSGAPAYNGVKLASFVYNQTYTVMEVKGDRIVIGQKRKVTAAVAAAYLIKQ